MSNKDRIDKLERENICLKQDIEKFKKREQELTEALKSLIGTEKDTKEILELNYHIASVPNPPLIPDNEPPAWIKSLSLKYDMLNCCCEKPRNKLSACLNLFL